jgi:hypothetical protein
MTNETMPNLLPCPQSFLARLMNDRFGKNIKGNYVCIVSPYEMNWLKTVAEFSIRTPIERKPKCKRCNDTGTWYGGADLNVEYPCDHSTDPPINPIESSEQKLSFEDVYGSEFALWAEQPIESSQSDMLDKAIERAEHDYRVGNTVSPNDFDDLLKAARKYKALQPQHSHSDELIKALDLASKRSFYQWSSGG